MRRLGLLLFLGTSALWAADSTTSPVTTPASTTASAPKPVVAVQKPAPTVPQPAVAATKTTPQSAMPKPLPRPPLPTKAGGPAGAQPAGKTGLPMKPAQVAGPVPARFLEIRNEMNEIYPDADKLPVIWDEAHDPFRFGYGAEDETTDAAGGDAAASGDAKPAAPPKMDLDTASLLEAGMDMLGGKGPKKPTAGGDSTSAKAFVPLTDAELLKRGVGKLRIGGVVVVRGVPRIMIDGVPRKIGEVVVVSVSGKQAKIQLVKIGDNTIEFVLQDAKAKPPSLEITF